MPDRNECVKCGVELPFYLGPDDLCPRCKGEVSVKPKLTEGSNGLRSGEGGGKAGGFAE